MNGEEQMAVNERLDRNDEQIREVNQHHFNPWINVSAVLKQDQHIIKSVVLDTNERGVRMEEVLENQHRIKEAELKRIK